ncbi:hypothetical protein [Alcanivorax sp.]|uniref:hypothetical protein n=1 Tax=Alcanivorax sp. TaxID=1872427 RepID=UPI0025C4677B|nr:hypothetical protein [Alcanivorax sp.]|tara:strand:+ start:226 stop:585 length:360 start_codon:yes stop_codon:yes gene_type:complete
MTDASTCTLLGVLIFPFFRLNSGTKRKNSRHVTKDKEKQRSNQANNHIATGYNTISGTQDKACKRKRHRNSEQENASHNNIITMHRKIGVERNPEAYPDKENQKRGQYKRHCHPVGYRY